MGRGSRWGECYKYSQSSMKTCTRKGTLTWCLSRCGSSWSYNISSRRRTDAREAELDNRTRRSCGSRADSDRSDRSLRGRSSPVAEVAVPFGWACVWMVRGRTGRRVNFEYRGTWLP